MRKVKFKKWVPEELIYPLTVPRQYKEGTKCWSDFIHDGVFHQWASGYEEFESGPANYTYALIELPDGTVEEVLPSNIKFVS